MSLSSSQTEPALKLNFIKALDVFIIFTLVNDLAKEFNTKSYQNQYHYDRLFGIYTRTLIFYDTYL